MGIFNMQNPFWRFMGKLFDVVVLNLLWTLCSLTVVTIGATTSAVYCVCIGLIRDEVSGAVNAFFRVLRRDWKQTVPMGLLLLAVVALLGFDLWYFLLVQDWLDGGPQMVVCVFLTLMLILTTATAIYSFALAAVFDNTVKETLHNALLMALRHPLRSLSMLAVTVGLAAAGGLSLIHIPALSVVFMMFGPALGIFLHCLILMPVLNPYLPEIEEME